VLSECIYSRGWGSNTAIITFGNHPQLAETAILNLTWDKQGKSIRYQKTAVLAMFRLSSRAHLHGICLASQRLETTSRQAKTIVGEQPQLLPSREQPGTSSGIGDEVQANQHEMHQWFQMSKSM
jgi:hypothetical protein